MKTSQLLALTTLTLPALLVSGLALGGNANPMVTVGNTSANPVPVTGQITVGNAVVPVEIRNANPIQVTTAPAPAWVGTPYFQTKFITSTSADNVCSTVAQAPAGMAILVTRVIHSFTLAPGLGGTMDWSMTPPGQMEHNVELGGDPTASVVTLEGLNDRYSGALDMGGYPVVEWKSCAGGGTASAPLRGVIRVFGFLVPLP